MRPQEGVPKPQHSPPRRFVLQWHVTERCNLRCQHCYQEEYDTPELAFRELLSVVEQFKALLDRLRREAAPESLRGHINVTGGEPFIRDDFLDLLQVFAANSEYFSFGILTNGTLIDAEMAQQLRAVGPRFVQVSVEGSPSTNDAVRGQDAFERTVTALEHLAKERIPSTIAFTAHRGNFREFSEVARLGRRLRVRRVWADRLIPWGSGLGLGAQSLRAEEAHEFFEIMQAAKRELATSFCPTEIYMGRALQFLVGGGRPYRCLAGESLVTIQPNGDLYPCRRMPICVGNVMETSLAELYYTSELFHDLRRHRVSEGCEQCRFVGECRGGLRCLAYAVTGDPFKGDPGCWRLSGNDSQEAPGRRISLPMIGRECQVAD